MLWMTVGLPGSGKTTYAKAFADLISAAYISTDAIRGELYGDEAIQGDGRRVWAIAKERAIEAMKAGKDVVWDSTNLIAKHRTTLIREMRRHTNKVAALYFDVPTAVCRKRNRERTRVVPERAMSRMIGAMQKPTTSEGLAFIVWVNEKGE